MHLISVVFPFWLSFMILLATAYVIFKLLLDDKVKKEVAARKLAQEQDIFVEPPIR